jgi:hypothetical protein
MGLSSYTISAYSFFPKYLLFRKGSINNNDQHPFEPQCRVLQLARQQTVHIWFILPDVSADASVLLQVSAASPASQ